MFWGWESDGTKSGIEPDDEWVKFFRSKGDTGRGTAMLWDV
jgi:hypothetical protein